jgi:hypothetical protein
MAESHEERMSLLFTTLLETYRSIRDVLLSLPIPLQLPEVPGGRVDIRPLLLAVDEAARIMPDLPVPATATQILVQALRFWNGAAILTETALVNPSDPFWASATTVLIHANSGMELAVMLLTGLEE